MVHLSPIRNLMLGLILLLGSGPVWAGVILSPSAIDLNLEGGSCEGRFSITNSGPRGESCTVKASDPVLQAGGGNLRPNGGEGPPFTIVFTPGEFELAPGRDQSIHYSVRPQGMIPTGVYRAQVQVCSPDSAEPLATIAATARVPEILQLDAAKPQADLSAAEPGMMSTTVRFVLRANSRVVRLYAEITPLRPGSTRGNDLPVVDLDLSRGVEISPTKAHPRDGSGGLAGYARSAGGADQARRSETLVFESDQQTGFEQEVLVTVWWRQGGPMETAGRYAGEVRLIALVGPE